MFAASLKIAVYSNLLGKIVGQRQQAGGDLIATQKGQPQEGKILAI
jgi:hypothetical protein